MIVGDIVLGKIIGIKDNIVLLKLNVKLEEMQNIINLYVMFEDNEKKLIGEIVDIDEGIAYVNLMGELDGDDFNFAVSKKPSFAATSKLISKDKVNYIIGMPDYSEKKYQELYISLKEML